MSAVTTIIFCQVSDTKISIDIKNPLGLACKALKSSELKAPVNGDQEPEQGGSRMAKDHLIIVGARIDEISTFGFLWLTSTTGGVDWFNNWQDAEKHTIELAKAWIDG